MISDITSLIFKKAGIDVHTEVHSSRGRCDVRVKTDKYFYVLELKLDGAAAEALQEIKDKGYLQPYGVDPRKKIAVGIAFTSEKRAVLEHLEEVL